MGNKTVIIFKPYAFSAGEKIHIAEGPRKGDWEVVSFTEHKVKLRCPISNREFNWDRFCYAVEKRDDVQWPRKD